VEKKKAPEIRAFYKHLFYHIRQEDSFLKTPPPLGGR